MAQKNSKHSSTFGSGQVDNRRIEYENDKNGVQRNGKKFERKKIQNE